MFLFEFDMRSDRLSDFNKIHYLCQNSNNELKIRTFMKRYLLIAVMFACVLTSCGTKKSDIKNLVLYYSQTGATETVAQELQKMLGADMEAIQLENPYAGTYMETIERVGKERQNGELPALLPLKSDLSKYDVIYLGYPIWYGTYAMPISSLVKDYDFAGKKVVTFCTFGSGGLEPAINDLKKALPDADIAENGFGIRNARMNSMTKELKRFMVENYYVEGTIEPLPEYSEKHPVTEEDIDVFNQACGDYQFPLGTPVSVGKRVTSESVDYIYDVESNGAKTTIYVTVSKTANTKPEFTRVVR